MIAAVHKTVGAVGATLLRHRRGEWNGKQIGDLDGLQQVGGVKSSTSGNENGQATAARNPRETSEEVDE